VSQVPLRKILVLWTCDIPIICAKIVDSLRTCTVLLQNFCDRCGNTLQIIQLDKSLIAKNLRGRDRSESSTEKTCSKGHLNQNARKLTVLGHRPTARAPKLGGEGLTASSQKNRQTLVLTALVPLFIWPAFSKNPRSALGSR